LLCLNSAIAPLLILESLTLDVIFIAELGLINQEDYANGVLVALDLILNTVGQIIP